MAARKALGLVFPTGLSIQPSLNRRVGVKVSVVQCSVSSVTSTDAASGLLEKPWSSYNARLVLKDGSVWSAKSFGAASKRHVFSFSFRDLDEYVASQGLNPDQCWRLKDGAYWNRSRWDLEPKHVVSFMRLMLKNTQKN